jgi:ABC-type sugar transport system substrate-binding protein
MNVIRRTGLLTAGLITVVMMFGGHAAMAQEKSLAYLTAGLDLAFWRYCSVGAEDAAKARGYSYTALDSHNSAQTQIQNTQDSIAKGVSAIVLSPTDSSTAPSVLEAAAKANVPVSFAGIGTVSGDYTTLVTSDDDAGAYAVGQALAKALADKGWKNAEIGMVTISQARVNGQRRTAGFERAMTEAGHKIVARNEMQNYTADETFRFVQDMLTAHPNMRGIFVQTDTPTLGAVRAIDAMHHSDDTLLAAFDGVPEFIDMIKSGSLVVSGMQQPYLMGKQAAEAVLDKLDGKTPEKEIVLPILIVTKDNVEEQLPTIKQTVFANEVK